MVIDMKFRLIILCICLFVQGTLSYGQAVFSFREGLLNPGFGVDYAYFGTDSTDINRLEVYYRIFNSDLMFVKDGNDFAANYEVSISIFDKGKRPIKSETVSRESRIHEYARTLSSVDFRVGQIDFYLEPGDYKVEYRLQDINSGDVISNDFKVKLSRFDNKFPQLSGVEFIYELDSLRTDTVFSKRGLTIIPDVTRIFGGDTTSVLEYYFEIFRGTGNSEKVMVETNLHDRNKNRVDQTREELTLSDNYTPVIRTYPLRSLKAGDYYLEISRNFTQRQKRS
jgi:hypothetical protein